MKKRLFFLLIGLSLNPGLFHAYSGDRNSPMVIDDGPYIIYENNSLKAKWIRNDILREEFITLRNFKRINRILNLRCKFSDLNEDFSLDRDYMQSYNQVDSIGAITDVHGQFNIYIKLLTAMGIIDNDMNWRFGKGHLVVLGDIFDRGDMVTEVLWHLFMLEKQAAEAGGKVHVLLGNHEFMTLNNDLGYINVKYRYVEQILNTGYSELYSRNSVMGRWLRSRPVAITINNIIFTHGGFSVELVKNEITIEDINRIYSDILADKLLGVDDAADAKILAVTENDPLWYRGYFRDSTFCESKIDSILDFYAKEHIVVGHTSFAEVKTLFNNKIIGVDAGIMYDQPGEMLIYKEGVFQRGLSDGRRIKL